MNKMVLMKSIKEYKLKYIMISVITIFMEVLVKLQITLFDIKVTISDSMYFNSKCILKNKEIYNIKRFNSQIKTYKLAEGS